VSEPWPIAFYDASLSVSVRPSPSGRGERQA